jgi:sucrose-6-phosphate hydrolase SacC (GH32 family)
MIPTVIYFNSQYHMIYQGRNIVTGTVRLGHATSPDGIDWTKDPQNPVIDVG